MPQAKCSCQGLLPMRRLHALIGLWMGCFLCVHLAVSLTGWSPSTYRGAVDAIQGALAHVPGFALLAIFLPLAGQAVSGLYLLRKEGLKYSVKKCNRGGKLRFFLQRVTGPAILVFALFHVGSLHPWGLHAIYRVTHLSALASYAAGGLFQPGPAAFRSTVEGFGGFHGGPAAGNLMLAMACLLGIWAAAFHAANGAWSGGVIWGLARTSQSNRRLKYVCTALGAVLLATGTLAWYAFTLSASARAAGAGN